MSVEVISWALNLAPVPADRGGQPSSASKFVLVGLANHAGSDGTGAFPSVATLVRYTGLSERTVRTCLDRLASPRASSRRATRASSPRGSGAPTGGRRAGTWTSAWSATTLMSPARSFRVGSPRPAGQGSLR